MYHSESPIDISFPNTFRYSAFTVEMLEAQANASAAEYPAGRDRAMEGRRFMPREGAPPRRHLKLGAFRYFAFTLRETVR